MSIFYLATTMAGIVSTGFLGYVQGHINGVAHPELYGQSLAFAYITPCLLTVPLFYFAGKHYVKAMKEKDE